MAPSGYWQDMTMDEARARIAELETALRGVLGWAEAHSDCGSMSDPENDIAEYDQDIARARAALTPKPVSE
jgi:hypothetical protein